MKPFLLAGLVAAAALPTQAFAGPVLFTGSSGGLAASVVFDTSGTNLLVRLTNTSLGDPIDPGDILSGVIFSLPGNPLLGKVSALVCPTCSVKGNGGVPGPGGVVGGEWAYTNALMAAQFPNQQSIYSSGYFDGNAVFPGPDLQGPPSGSVDGIQYGITTLFDTTGNDNGGLSGQGLVANEVDFVLSGLPAGFDTASITGVSFQYGTDLRETNFPGTHRVPEPGSLALAGLALCAATLLRKRKA